MKPIQLSQKQLKILENIDELVKDGQKTTRTFRDGISSYRSKMEKNNENQTS